MTYRTQRVEDDGVKRPRRTRHAQYLTHACEARTSIISEILRGAPQAPPGPKRLCAAPTNLHSKPARPDAAAMRNGVEGVGDDRGEQGADEQAMHCAASRVEGGHENRLGRTEAPGSAWRRLYVVYMAGLRVPS